jgi:predicted N-acyltransferase
MGSFVITPLDGTAVPTNLAELEPSALLRHFSENPPEGFDSFVNTDGCHGFYAPFDLLTTADDGFVASINALPGNRWLRKLLTLRTCFFGTTVSEYCPLPGGVAPKDMLQTMMKTWNAQTMLMIVKDVVDQSPLLSAEANQYARDFVADCFQKGFILVEGQALAYVPIDFASEDEYLSRLSSGRRRDIRRKLRARENLRVEVLKTGCEALHGQTLLDELYAQYQEVYAQSEIHFDRLSAEFFRSVLQDATLNGRLFMYFNGERLIGYNLCFVHQGMLIDKYVGFRYPAARDFNLYFVSWIENLAYARAHGLRYYVAGWTDPEIKSYLGASFTFTRHLVFVRNPILRFVLRRLSGLFESDRKWFEANIHARPTDS